MRQFVIVVVVLAALTSCSDGSPTDSSHNVDQSEMSHVHGLGTDPADGSVYVATHYGVFRLHHDGSGTRVADRWQDTMAFTVVGPRHFLGSGHPDLRDLDQPPHLGLIESKDAGETWQIVSRGGESDFHAIDASPGRINAYDAVSGRLLTSPDGQTWTEIAETEVIDLASDPTNPARVLVTRPDGSVVELSAERASNVERRVESPALVYLDWPAPDLLVGLGAGGEIYRSSDGGQNWEDLADLRGNPQALDVSPKRWLAATESGIFTSEDQGHSWQPWVDFQSGAG